MSIIVDLVVGTREPDEVRGSVVGSDTVEVVALERTTLFVGLLFANPCECDGNMEIDVSMIAHLIVPLYAVAVEAVTRARVKDGCYLSVDPYVLTGRMVFDVDVRKGASVESDVEGSVAGAFHVRHAADFDSIR